MADFVKYNGYNVKDASALAHASVSGNTLTTTDRKGRTVDSIELPGGLALSATHMSYWPKKLVTSYNNSCEDAFRNTNDVSTSNANCAVGQVIGSEMIGYGEIDWNSSSSCFTLTGIRAVTTHGWRNFTRDTSTSNPTTKSSFKNDLCRQYRPINYKAYLNVGMKDKSITIPAGTTKTILQPQPKLVLKEPAGYANGYVAISKVIPTADTNNTGIGVQLYYVAHNSVKAYNPTSSDVVIKSFVVELDITFYNEYAERFFHDAPDVPFIEAINCTSLTDDSNGIVEKTSVVVKHHDHTSNYYLYEFKLTLDNSTGAWSWTQSNIQALGDGPASDTNRNKLFTFSHTILTSDFMTAQTYTSAVAYALGAGGSSIGVNAYFTDGIPLPAMVNIS